MCTYLIGSGPKIKEINGSPFANLFSEAAPRGGEANEGGARRRALELSAAVRAGQSVRLGPLLLVHLSCPPGRIRLVPSVQQDQKVRRRGFGFALESTQPFATRFCGLFPSPFIPNSLYWSPTGQAHSMEKSFPAPLPRRRLSPHVARATKKARRVPHLQTPGSRGTALQARRTSSLFPDGSLFDPGISFRTGKDTPSPQ